MKKVTIFTPTYNRKYLLERVYNSLKSQINKNFIWLIVDDGSNDGTREFIEKLKLEGIINITYIYQENSGKMQAHNVGVINCETDYFVCLDSDDLLTNEAVEMILNNVDKITKENCAGIIAYKCISKDKRDLLGSFFNTNYSTLSGIYDNGYIGETTLIFKTEVIKQYLFPKFKNEKFITEVYIYDRIDRKYCYYILPEILTIYEYQEYGLTNSIYNLIKNNPMGYMEYWKQKFIFSCEDKKLSDVVKSAINYLCFSFNANIYTIKALGVAQFLVLVVLYPIGFLKYTFLNEREK